MALGKNRSPVAFAVCLLLVLWTTYAAARDSKPLDAAEIVKTTDQIRFPKNSFSMIVDVTSYRGDQPSNAFSLLVYSSDRGRSTLVKWLSPPRDKGKMLLLLEDDLWMIFPNVKRPVRISPQQKLLGEVSAGDVARLVFADHYNAQVVKEETFNGQEVMVLELRAKNDKIDYSKIVFRVDRRTFSPVQAEYYALSGRLLKRGLFEEYEKVDSQVRPTKLVLMDVLSQGQKTVMKLSQLREQAIPVKYFDKNYLMNAR